MLLTDFSEKKYRKMLVKDAREEGKLEGRLEGREEGKAEGRILTVRIFQEARKNPKCTEEEIAGKVGCTVQEVEDTLKMFGVSI